MIDVLAQTGGWRTWDAQGVALIITALTGLVTAILAHRRASDAKQESKSAKTDASDAKSEASAAKAATDVNTQRVSNLSGQVFDVVKAMPPVPLSPPAPTPEAITRAVNQPEQP